MNNETFVFESEKKKSKTCICNFVGNLIINHFQISFKLIEKLNLMNGNQYFRSTTNSS